MEKELISLKIKTKNEKFIRKNLNDYEGYIVSSILDWDVPKLRNCLRYSDKININSCVNSFGTTLLHYAASKQNCILNSKNSLLHLLLDAGANPLLKDSSGLTAYDYAKIKNYQRNMEVIKSYMNE